MLCNTRTLILLFTKSTTRRYHRKYDKIALLIDGENVSPKFMLQYMSHISLYGSVAVKRVYGNWSSGKMKAWSTVLDLFKLQAIQCGGSNMKKNSADICLVIQAMDLIHSKSVDAFCIVSGDGDFAGLAKRIK
jgi:uncharacterized LabA/DUF88 family protein